MFILAKRLALLVTLSAVLAACSSESEKQPSLSNVAFALAKAKLGKAKAKVEKAETVPTKAPQKIPLEALAQYGKPVIYVSIPRMGSSLPAIEVAKNGKYRTYLGGDKASITLQDGMVTSTRGQIVDLFAQSLSMAPAQIFYDGNFPKTYSRSQRHLTGEGVLATQNFTCAIAPADKDEELDVLGRKVSVRQFTELCQNKTRAFQNSYWVDLRAKRIWQSHQSISKEVGHVIVQIAVP